MESGFSAGSIVANIKANTTQFKAGLAEAQGQASGFGSSLSSSLGGVATAFGVLGAAGVAAGVVAVNAFRQQEDATARLQNNIMNVKSARDKDISSLLDQASALQKVTRFSDEQIISGQGMLATFQLNQQTIKALTPSMLDMAEGLRDVNGQSIGLEEASKLMGKAMGSASDNIDGLATALRRQGVIMTDAQKEIFHTGTEAERTATLVQIMNQNFGGGAEAAGKTFSGRMTIMSNQLNEIQERIGGVIAGALQPFVLKLTTVAESISDWMDKNPKLTQMIIGLGMVLTGLAITIAVVTAAVWALNAAFIASPVGWIVLAIAAIAGAIYLVVEKTVGWGNVWNGLVQIYNSYLKPALQHLWDFIQTNIVPAWNKLVETFNAHVMPALRELWTTIQEKLIPPLKEFWQQHGPAITKGFMIFAAILGGVVLAALYGIVYGLEFVIKAVTWLVDIVGQATHNFNQRWKEAKAGFETNMNIIKGIINTVVHRFNELVSFVQHIPQHFNEFVRASVNFLQRLPHAAGEALGRLVRFFMELPGNVATALSNFYNTAMNWIENTRQGIINTVMNIINAVGNYFAQLPGRVIQVFTDLVNGVTNWLQQLPGRASEAGQGLLNGFMSMINQLPGLINGIFNQVISTIMSWNSELWNKAKEMADNFWKGFKDGLGIHSPSYIERAFMAIGDQSSMTLKQMKQDVGMLNNLSNTLPTVDPGAKPGSSSTNVNSKTVIGNVHLDSQEAVDGFFKKINRNDTLVSMGLTGGGNG